MLLPLENPKSAFNLQRGLLVCVWRDTVII